MDEIKILEKLLKEEVLIEIKTEISALKKLASGNKNNFIEELNYLLEVEKFYNEVINLIENKKLSKEEAKNLLLDLEDMEVDHDEV